MDTEGTEEEGKPADQSGAVMVLSCKGLWNILRFSNKFTSPSIQEVC
jgi:hypothetical protein